MSDLNQAIIDDNQTNPSIESNAVLADRLSKLMSASWEDYYQQLNQLSAGYQVSACLKLLNDADQLLNQGRALSESTPSERNLIAGLKDAALEKTLAYDHQLLGDMQGFGSFKKVVKSDPAGLEKLMRVIPINGPIDGWHFMQFVDTYQQWFENNGYKQFQLFPATRLLAMKRPDQFVSITEETLQLFTDALNVKRFKKGEFQRYWDDIIVPLQKSAWFNAFQPMEPAQIPFHRVRFALLERMVATPVNESELRTVTIARETAQIDSITQEPAQKPESTLKQSATPQFIKEERTIKVKKPVKQPKKMTITQRQSAKVNQNAATKLMSQYYFANKDKFAKVDMGKHRPEIVQRLVDGESVEEVFESYLK